MASTTTTRLGLFKATPGTNEPFRIDDVNGNWDLVDGFAQEYDTEFADLEARVSTAESDITNLSAPTASEITGVSYSLQASDSNSTIRCNNQSVMIFQIENVLAPGEQVSVVMDGAQVSFGQGTGVTLQSAGGKYNTNEMYGVTTIYCVAAGQYRIYGNLI